MIVLLLYNKELKQSITILHRLYTDSLQLVGLIVLCLLLSLFRGLSCGVYATNSADVCQYIADDCQANIAVVEDQKQLDKFLQVCVVGEVCEH